MRAVGNGLSCHVAAHQFGVSPSSAIRWMAMWRKTGSVEPLKIGGDRWSYLIEEHSGWLLDRVSAVPDITLRELRDGLAERGLKTSQNALHNFFKRHDLTYKKRRLMQRSRNVQT